jgi:hypothetical protein
VGDRRQLVELDVTWALPSWTEVRGAANIGQEENAAIGGGIAKFGGLQLIVRQDLARFDDVTLYLAGRVTWWRDQGGSRCGTDQTLLEGTATVGLQVLRHGLLRLEVRRDQSSAPDVFPGPTGALTRSTMTTFAFDLSVTF